MLSLLSFSITTYLLAMASMAFFTLLERKLLGYSQLRKGPNKVSLMGLPQPIADAVKLFTKEQSKLSLSNTSPFIMAPLLNLFLALLFWSMTPSWSPLIFLPYGIILFLCLSSLSVYTTLGAGWSSNSKYSLLGATRSIAQTISYEVSMALILISILMFLKSLNFQLIMNSMYINVVIISPILTYMWFTTVLAETNRTPFDLAEGESELVSGFNTEYASGGFALIFMSEYLNILFMAIITSILTIQNHISPYISFTWMMTKGTVFAMLFIMVRTTLPRMRYDRLMSLTWMSFLPTSLMCILMFLPLV